MACSYCGKERCWVNNDIPPLRPGAVWVVRRGQIVHDEWGWVMGVVDPDDDDDADAEAVDPLTGPLPVAAPGSWSEREDRVRWVLANFTEGEKAKLYEQLHGEGFELSNTRRRWKAEREKAGMAGR